MTRYDKIWVPEKRQGADFGDAEGDAPAIVTGPVIVLTLQELREVWDASREGYTSGWGGDYDNIEEYLKEKGIKI